MSKELGELLGITGGAATNGVDGEDFGANNNGHIT
jgi:hypothetical protein